MCDNKKNNRIVSCWGDSKGVIVEICLIGSRFSNIQKALVRLTFKERQAVCVCAICLSVCLSVLLGAN